VHQNPMSMARNSTSEVNTKPLGFEETICDLSADIVEYFTEIKG